MLFILTYIAGPCILCSTLSYAIGVAVGWFINDAGAQPRKDKPCSASNSPTTSTPHPAKPSPSAD